MVSTNILCRKHLLGEHLECHMFLSALKRKQKVNGYIKKNLLEVGSLRQRHDQLALELRRRGYNHHSPLNPFEASLDHLSVQTILHKINVEESLQELLKRCEFCRERYLIEVMNVDA